MIELEKLYKCAEKHLTKPQQDWERFSAEFADVFDVELGLFLTPISEDVVFLHPEKKFIIATMPDAIEDYFREDLQDFVGIVHEPANPFQPSSRTDNLSDAEYLDIKIVQSFFLKHRAFYFMLAFADLSDNSRLVMVVWRSIQQSDFSDIEKQRIALFMRYLATFFDTERDHSISLPGDDIIKFSKKYGLTGTEMEILSALLEGHSLKSIATDTGRAYRTIRWHVQNILEKCQVTSQKNLLSEFYQLIKR